MTVSGRCSVSDEPDRDGDLEIEQHGRLLCFLKLPRIEAHRNRAFGPFIGKTRSLEDSQEDRKRIKDRSAGLGRPRGRQQRRRGLSGALRDKSTEVFWCFDGQRGSIMWLCAGPEEMTQVIGVSRQDTGYTAGTMRKLKSAAAGGDVESGSVPVVPPWGRQRVGAMAPLCNQGFGPSMGGSAIPPTRVKSESDIEEISHFTR
jgi:hypothetical protein